MLLLRGATVAPAVAGRDHRASSCARILAQRTRARSGRASTTSAAAQLFGPNAFWRRGGGEQQQQLSDFGDPAQAEGPDFAPVEDVVDGAVGPLGVLAVGFDVHESNALGRVLSGVGLEEAPRVMDCTRAMLQGTLVDALRSGDGNDDDAPLVSIEPRALFLSGMSPPDLARVVDACIADDALGRCAFAALVPRNMNRNLGDVLTEVLDDDRRMSAQA